MNFENIKNMSDLNANTLMSCVRVVGNRTLCSIAYRAHPLNLALCKRSFSLRGCAIRPLQQTRCSYCTLDELSYHP